jgi:hypothetical protein
MPYATTMILKHVPRDLLVIKKHRGVYKGTKLVKANRTRQYQYLLYHTYLLLVILRVDEVGSCKNTSQQCCGSRNHRCLDGENGR